MFLPTFTYHRAESVDDAVAQLAADPEARVLAGGHSLIPAMKLRLAMPGVLIDISALAELKAIEVADEISIGAMATYDEIARDDRIAAVLPIFRMAMPQVGDPQVRARGTFGGSVAHADPAADLTAVFLALGGRAVVQGEGGERELAADDWFIDLWTTALESGEVLTRLLFTLPADGTRMSYQKHRHPASGYAVVGVAAVVPVVDEKVHGARIAITGATPKPERLRGVEDVLEGKVLDEDTINEAVDVVADGLQVMGDLYADEEFRTQLLRVYTRRALNELIR